MPAQGPLTHTLTGHTGEVHGIAFSPDGNKIATGRDDGTILLWNARGTIIQTLTGHTDTVSRVVFSPDGNKIASDGYDNTVRLWDARTGTLIHTLHTGGDQRPIVQP